MIPANEAIQDLVFLLDDNRTGRYTDDNDFIPAINLAIDHIVHLFSVIFEKKLLFAEVLKELYNKEILTVSAPQSSSNAVVTFDPAFDITNVWKVIGVEPNVTVINNVYYGSTNSWAEHISFNEWNIAYESPFSAGSGVSTVAGKVTPAFTVPYYNNKVL